MENNKKIKIVNQYTKEEKEVTIPNNSKYDFLLERNQKYMNYNALSFKGKKEKITYEELHTRIEEYTRALYKQGIRKDDVIAVCGANTPEFIYLLYALDIIGATVVGLSPLNNEYKMKRDIEMVKPTRLITIDMMYGKCKNACKSLNVSPILYSPLESMNSPFMKMIYNVKQFLDGNKVFGKNHNLRKIIREGKNASFERTPFVPNQVNDVLFTGGSTGIHKGVDLSSNGLNSVVKALDEVLILEPGMTHLGNIPFGHMCFGRLVMHYALCKNLEFALTLDALPNKFYDELVRTQADGAMGGPVHWNAIAQTPNIKPGSLSNLKQGLSGGEMFKPEDKNADEKSLKEGGCYIEIGDGLGLTEMWAPTHVNMGGKNTPGTIGFAIPFVQSKVVSLKLLENFEPNVYQKLPEVPIGEVGMLLVSGPGMMLGYHNNIVETNKIFIYDENGTKWYITGDLVRRYGIDNNEFKFAGRQKRNFVCGVDNIYPEQVEAKLLELPEIKEVVVTKVPDEKYQFLPSYHICLANDQIDTTVLKNKMETLIESTLGASALPGYIEYTLEPLQKTDNGKLNAPFYEAQDLKKNSQENGLNLVRKVY